MRSLFRRFYLVTALAVLTVPAYAQKPLTADEARAIALEKVPGTVVDTERSIHNGAVVYEFDIRQENGTVMDIEIDSVTREILELKVDGMGTGGILPEPGIEEDVALEKAIKHIEDTTSGLRSVDKVKAEYKIVGGAIAYVFRLRRGITSYDVVVDANSGRIISSKETP